MSKQKRAAKRRAFADAAQEQTEAIRNETTFEPFVPKSGDVVAEASGFTEFRGEFVRFETKYYKP